MRRIRQALGWLLARRERCYAYGSDAPLDYPRESLRPVARLEDGRWSTTGGEYYWTPIPLGWRLRLLSALGLW